MKCTNDEQYEAAMTALIAGTTGTVRESLTAIHEYLGKRPSDVVVKILPDPPVCVNCKTLEEYNAMHK
ncbi:hypothetical protein FACS189483_06540 [Spirochaetia bacterium]|nr:hypothetical protein FACS189483_06540 [Spirochaetia bacterium]